ncbi:hypothetical protein [Erythrobacter sp.]|uniref:hypothetical protein n=1 Tax=Erythrobacter sp. TaxID=1042 RepID=UPI001B169EBD|nr:hypothetical protein [Erythrobacter sp.]MBO6526698.1 hypothetical protein [Erythrobacter sp.]MBO6531079.1 hypothetical protein [Erythrobacter sp.]MBO6768536.1 hypothetical protein [Erythrobacter sp.]
MSTAKVLNRVPPHREDTLFKRESLQSIVSGSAGIDAYLRTIDPLEIEAPFRASRELVDLVLEEVPDRLDTALQAAGRRELGKHDWEDIRPEIEAFVIDACDIPKCDGALAYANVQAATPVLVRNGDSLLAVYNDGQVEYLSENISDESAIAEAAFYVDVLIQIIGTLTSAIGLKMKPPKKASSAALREAMKTWRQTGRNKELWEAILYAIKAKNWAKFLKLIHKAEFWTIFSEFFAHMFADMSWKDYVVAIAKMIAWIAAGALSGGAAAAAKVAMILLDLVGLGLKIKHKVEHTPPTA